MGENFLRRKNDRYVTHRGAYFLRAIERDLFAMCSPELQTQVVGAAIGGVAANDELWTPDLAGDGPIRFCLGSNPTVQIVGAAADLVRKKYGAKGTVVAQVVEFVVEHKFVVLRLGGTK